MVLRPGQRHMAPFTGDRIGPRMDLTAHRQPAAAASAHNDAEHRMRPGGGPVTRLRYGQAVGVVRHPHRPAKPPRQVMINGMADQPDGIGVLHQPRAGRYRARNTHANHTRLAGILFQPADHAGYGLQGGAIVAARRRNTLPGDHRAVIRQDNAFDLAATQVNADTHDRTLSPGPQPAKQRQGYGGPAPSYW